MLFLISVILTCIINGDEEEKSGSYYGLACVNQSRIIEGYGEDGVSAYIKRR